MNKTVDLKELLEGKLKNIKPSKDNKKAIEAAEKNLPKDIMYYAESTELETEAKSTSPKSVTRKSGMTLKQAQKFNDNMKQFIDTILVAGVDYGTLPKCSKPTLLKSGAEKVITFLGLVTKTEITNRVEDYNAGFFGYEVQVSVIDEVTGVVKGVGIGAANTKESKYAKGNNAFNYQNVVLKMAKKRALVDVALNVGNLSARFTQDVEDLDIKPEQQERPDDKGNHNKPSTNGNNGAKPSERQASQKQLNYLTSLMTKHNTSANAMNRYTKQHFGVDEYNKISSTQASLLIDKYIALEKQ